MSHHSDENLLTASSDSFWEPGNYKRTTKRIDDGHRLCTDLIQLVQERAEIEKNYAKSLKSWTRRWNELIDKGPEYGTTQAAWKGVLVEADRLSDLHLQIKNHLCEDVPNQVKSWQKDNYHKSMMVLKEKKEMEDNFKKAQKPWVKVLTKVNKAKQDYHNACKNERSAANQERNATGDNAVSAEQRSAAVRKLAERVQRAKEEVQRTKEKYETALHEINGYNPKYMEDMTEVFDKCQQMETERLVFFKEVLFNIHRGLNISQDPALPQIYEELYHTVNNADHDKDVKWWSNIYGVNMSMNWPQFEEPGSMSTTLDKGRRARPGPKLMESNTKASHAPAVGAAGGNLSKSGAAGNGSAGGVTKSSNDKINSSSNRVSSVSNGNRPEGNPFEEEEEWEEYPNDALVDNGEPGVAVRALYDYDGAECDELSFRKGETFEKLEDEDEQGWCKGRKDGRVGLYPANYVEVI